VVQKKTPSFSEYYFVGLKLAYPTTKRKITLSLSLSLSLSLAYIQLHGSKGIYTPLKEILEAM
jgi:hypothetical protein